MAVLVGVEQEKFTLRPHVKTGETHILRLTQDLFQQSPGIPLKGGAVGLVHIADKARGPAFVVVPGENKKGVQIGIQVHIRFLDAYKALDGGTVEHALVAQRLGQLAGRNGNILEAAENIRKLQADKPDVLLPDDADDILRSVFAAHPPSTLSASARPALIRLPARFSDGLLSHCPPSFVKPGRSGKRVAGCCQTDRRGHRLPPFSFSLSSRQKKGARQLPGALSSFSDQHGLRILHAAQTGLRGIQSVI